MEKQKLTKRQTQANKTKNKIHKVSMDLMEKKGYNNTTVEEISKKAGVSVGTFYLYYKSKEDILFETYKASDEYFEKEVAPQIMNKEFNSIQQILLFFKFYGKYTKERGLQNISQLLNTKNKLFISKGRYMQNLLQEIISTGQENNELRKEVSSENITEYLFIVVRGLIYDWCLHNADYDIEERMVTFLNPLVDIFKNNSKELPTV
jgi:AcrR family transcriptional regulator